MRKIYLILLVVAICFQSPIAFGQFGKLLQEKAKNVALTKGKDKLKDLASQELDKARNNFDSTSFSYAISLNDNSGLYDIQEKGEVFLKAYSNLGKKDEDKEERERARDLLDQGDGLYASGYYSMAEAVLLTAKKKYEDEKLVDDINYPRVFSTLGLLYSTMGRYTTAEEFINQSLELRREMSGEKSGGYGASLNNLAVLYKETGKYNEAEKRIILAVEILGSVHGKESMPVAIALNNEAMLYQAMGRYDQADEVLNEAIKISAKIQNEKSGNHQKFLTNQALLYQEMGKLELAEKVFKELIALKERRFGKRHPDYAHMLNNLAALYMQMGKHEEVESLLKEAIGVYERKFGNEHRLYAAAISDLGNFYRFSGSYDEAKPLLNQTLKIREKVLGTQHPQYVQSKENMAILHWKMNEWKEAENLYRESLDQSLTFVKEYFPPMSEAEKTKYWDKLRPRFERYYAFVAEASVNNPALLENAFNYHVATKGLLLKATNKIKQGILSSGDQGLIDAYLQWLDQKETLARLYSYSKEELAEQKTNRDSLERAANATERKLSQQSQSFADGYKLNDIGYKEIQEKLGTTDVALEFIRFRAYENTFTNEVKYLVLAVKKTDQYPQKVLISNGSQLETRYFKYYNNVIHQKINDDYSYDQFWAPIDPLTKGAKQVYLSLDGIYNQINLNTLRKPSGEYLISSYNFLLVGNTTELTAPAKKASLSKNATLVGFPEYGGTGIPALPGTKVEMGNISKILAAKGYKVNTLSGVEASEIKFKAINNPKLLHVATHGYFMEDTQLTGNKVFGISAESARDNPLLRSGLLLAGAGKVSGYDHAVMESEDNGILTAYEAMNLSLDDTDLVVLSACETAVGDVKAGEGVYGLQRAFLAAGADALIMSLWKVDDAATQELMTKFYTHWLKMGNKQQAFKAAQLELKNKYKDPYYWGAFILIGN